MYVPMMKARQAELKALEITNDLFSEEIIPLIEILNDKYKNNYAVDPVSKEFIIANRNGKNCRVKIPPTEDCIITLETINKKARNKKIFIDYFRFQEKYYGRGLNFNSLQLSWLLSNNEDKYLDYLKNLCKFKNVIPVISIKKGFGIREHKLKLFIKNLHEETPSIALRITEEFFDEYSEVIRESLNKNDYLLFDIENQNPDSKIMELLELSSFHCECKKILLASPRNSKYKNSDFCEHGICEVIYTSARIQSEDNFLDRYGDYCGLKDSLPKIGSNGKGAALALFYDSKINKFYSYVEKNTDLGSAGYHNLIPIIQRDSVLLDPAKDCLAMIEVNDLQQKNSAGNWSSWHKINIIRSIHQVYKYYNK